jgi:sugar diacid utilization regulator
VQRLGGLLARLPDDTLTVLAGPEESTREVGTLSTVDAVDQLREAQAGALVLVPRYCTEQMTGYELDVAVRYAADRGVAGLVLMGSDKVPVTVRALASRAEITLLGCPATQSLVELVRHIDRLLDLSQVAAIERARSVLTYLRGLDEPREDDDDLLRTVSARLGSPVRLDWLVATPPGGEPAEPVAVGGRTAGWVHVSDVEDPAAMLVLPSIAAVLGRMHERRVQLDEAKGDIVASLIDADASTEDRVAQRARDAGINVDARHVIACIVNEQQSFDGVEESLVARRHRRALVALFLREVAGLRSEDWIVTRVERDIAILHSRAGSPDMALQPSIDVAEQAIAALRDHYPNRRFFAGVGSAGSGLEGLRSSALEARAAARYARAQGTPDRAVQLDASRLGQVLSEIVASPVSRRAINDLLAPLDTLPDGTRYASVLTLSTYLDLQGSLRRAGAVLHLHPNAVSYRINKIMKLVEVDLTDRDARFALQLACRVWLMHHAKQLAPDAEDLAEA